MALVFDPIKALDHAGTLGVAFAGATAAFMLERHRRKGEQRDTNVAALNRALYTIFNIWNIQEQLRKDVVEAWRTKEDAWFNMPATPPMVHGTASFDAVGLAFLLGKDSELYSQLMLEEQRFAALTYLVGERSRAILSEAWPRLAAAGFSIGSSIPVSEIENTIGYDLVRRLKVYTPSITANVLENLVSLQTTHDRLRSRARQLFPGEPFLKIEFKLPTT